MSEATPQIFFDKLLTPKQAGEILHLSERGVMAEIAAGKLRAKRRVVRGKGLRPRKFVLYSEAMRYLNEMESAPAGEPQSSGRARRGNVGEEVIQFVS